MPKQRPPAALARGEVDRALADCPGRGQLPRPGREGGQLRPARDGPLGRAGPRLVAPARRHRQPRRQRVTPGGYLTLRCRPSPWARPSFSSSSPQRASPVSSSSVPSCPMRDRSSRRSSSAARGTQAARRTASELTPSAGATTVPTRTAGADPRGQVRRCSSPPHVSPPSSLSAPSSPTPDRSSRRSPRSVARGTQATRRRKETASGLTYLTRLASEREGGPDTARAG